MHLVLVSCAGDAEPVLLFRVHLDVRPRNWNHLFGFVTLGGKQEQQVVKEDRPTSQGPWEPKNTSNFGLQEAAPTA